MDDSQERMEDLLNLAEKGGKLFQIGNQFFKKDKIVSFKYELETDPQEGKLKSIKFVIRDISGQETLLTTNDVKVARTIESFLCRVLD